MPREFPSEPWQSFLNDLDAALEEHTAPLPGRPRSGDGSHRRAFGGALFEQRQAPENRGQGIAAGKKHAIYLDVPTAPEDYATRLTPLYPSI